MEVDLDEMEVKEVSGIPTWAAALLTKSKVIAKELGCDGPLFFKDDSVMLYNAKYHMETQRL